MRNRLLAPRFGMWLGITLGFGFAATLGGLSFAANVAPVDADGDGVASVASGGSDCDDHNPRRFPGNDERCDSQHLDEDCDPSTTGATDADGDGYLKAQCCNRMPNGVRCGNDPDDTNPAIKPGAVECSGKSPYVVQLSGLHTKSSCTAGTVCIDQPNKTGTCGVAPASYKKPAKKKFWKKPTKTAPVTPSQGKGAGKVDKGHGKKGSGKKLPGPAPSFPPLN